MSIKFLTWLTTYIIIVLCELGDKTQVAVLLFTSKNPGKRWTIFCASALALILCVIVEVTVGLTLARYIGPHLINRGAGVIFLLIGLVTLYKGLDISEKLSLANPGKRYADQAR
jgi:putative Ca2+/H+ antiporter (TMEM165/GDT1 family)